MITYHKTVTVTIDCSVLSAERIVDSIGMLKGVVKVDPYASNIEKTWKVYKLVSKKDPNAVYIGSTCTRLSQRLGGHMSEMKIYPDAVKSKWLKDNAGYVEIHAIAAADSEDDVLPLEEEQMKKYIKLGFKVLNRKYPATGKPYPGQDDAWGDPGFHLRIFDCIEQWEKTKNALPTLRDIRWSFPDMALGNDFVNTMTQMLAKAVLEKVWLDEAEHFKVAAIDALPCKDGKPASICILSAKHGHALWPPEIAEKWAKAIAEGKQFTFLDHGMVQMYDRSGRAIRKGKLIDLLNLPH